MTLSALSLAQGARGPKSQSPSHFDVLVSPMLKRLTDARSTPAGAAVGVENWLAIGSVMPQMRAMELMNWLKFSYQVLDPLTVGYESSGSTCSYGYLRSPINVLV